VKVRPWAAAIAIAAVLAPAHAPEASAKTPRQRAGYAVHYIASQQKPNGAFKGSLSPVGTAADAVLALVAARRSPQTLERAVAFLDRRVEQGDADTIGLKSKVVMAVVAWGADPTDFGGSDLVAEIRDSTQPDGRLGADTPVFEHALGLLALRAADVDLQANSADWLAMAQCGDGGWQFDEPAAPTDDEHCISTVTPSDDFFPSDTNTTSLAVQALAFDGAPAPDADPLAFFEATRDDVKRGWGYTSGFLTDTNSTALVLQAYYALGHVTPNGSPRRLRKLQYRGCSKAPGAFAFTWEQQDDGSYVHGAPNVAATIAAVPALLGRPLPIGEADVTKRAPRWSCPR
jgi:hypothetical protein